MPGSVLSCWGDASHKTQSLSSGRQESVGGLQKHMDRAPEAIEGRPSTGQGSWCARGLSKG